MRRLSKESISYICSECGAPIDGEYSLCEDCINDRKKQEPSGLDLVVGIESWCRFRSCDYDCSKCQFLAQEKKGNKNERGIIEY